jgi:hypothetical protein
MAEISHSASGPLLPGGFEMDQDSTSPRLSLPTWRAWWLWPPTIAAPPTLVPQATPRRSQPTCSSRRFDKRRMAQGGAKTAGNRAEGAGRQRRATGAECGRGSRVRGWCRHFGYPVWNGLVNVFRPDFACETAGILVIYDIMHSVHDIMSIWYHIQWYDIM